MGWLPALLHLLGLDASPSASGGDDDSLRTLRRHRQVIDLRPEEDLEFLLLVIAAESG